MSGRFPNLVWAGAALAAVFWLAESLMHAFVFGSGALSETLVGEHDPNEVWMRTVVSALFISFGWVAEKAVRAERHAKEEAQRLSHLLRFLDHIMRGIRRRAAERSAAGRSAPEPPLHIQDLALSDADVAMLARFVQELSGFVDSRFRELYALLELAHDISMGMLLEEVLDKAYETLRSVIPYNRLGVALIEDDGRIARAHWARSDTPVLMLKNGFASPLEGSSLQEIIAQGEPRIINDLVAYFDAHPHSDSTRLIVAEGIRSNLTCPLVSSGRPIGFMFFSSRLPDTYRDAHVEIFKLIAGHFSVVLEKSNLYQQILREKEQSERLLLNVMPTRIAARLRAGDRHVAEHLSEISVLFGDIVGFTGFAGRNSPEHVLEFLEEVFVRLDDLCDRYHVDKIKTIGDEYMAVSGPGGGGQALRNLALFALEALRSIEDAHFPDGQPLMIRIGMHCGPAVGGVIGQKKFAYDIWGDTVNIANRMQAASEPGRIQVSEDVYLRLRDDFEFEKRGAVELKGKGAMTTYYLKGGKARPAAA